MKKFMEEFKAFAMRGNVIDMAVGVIIGGAFKAIADSLVNDIINPALGVFTGGHTDLSGLSFSLPGGGEGRFGTGGWKPWLRSHGCSSYRAEKRSAPFFKSVRFCGNSGGTAEYFVPDVFYERQGLF